MSKDVFTISVVNEDPGSATAILFGSIGGKDYDKILSDAENQPFKMDGITIIQPPPPQIIITLQIKKKP